MIITFENKNNVIVYTLKNVIFHARNKQYMFVA